MENDLSSLAEVRQNAGVVPAALTVEQFKLYAWIIRGLILAAIVGALWYARVEGKLSELNRQDTERANSVSQLAAQTKALSDYIAANNLVNATSTAQNLRVVERVTKNENRLDEIATKVGEMWFMRQHGVSNKEAFAQDHGIPLTETLEKKQTP